MAAQGTSPSLNNDEDLLGSDDNNNNKKQKQKQNGNMKVEKWFLSIAMVLTALLWIISHDKTVFCILVVLANMMFWVVVNGMEEEDIEFLVQLMRWNAMKEKLDYVADKLFSIAIINYLVITGLIEIEMETEINDDDDVLVDADDEGSFDAEVKQENDGDWVLVGDDLRIIN